MPAAKFHHFPIRILFFFLLLAVSDPVLADNHKRLVLATADSSTDVVQAYFQLFQRVYGEIGYGIELRRYPVQRSYVQADLDKVDGILLSTEHLLSKYKNLIRVPVELTRVDLVVYSIHEDFIVEGATSLQDHRIGVLRGYPLSHAITEGLARQTVNDYTALFTILKIGRVDIVIALRRETERFLAMNPAFGAVKALHPPLFSLPMYHFVNKRHRDLVPGMTPIIERLLKEKVLERFYEPYSTK